MLRTYFNCFVGQTIVVENLLARRKRSPQTPTTATAMRHDLVCNTHCTLPRKQPTNHFCHFRFVHATCRYERSQLRWCALAEHVANEEATMAFGHTPKLVTPTGDQEGWYHFMARTAETIIAETIIIKMATQANQHDRVLHNVLSRTSHLLH